MLCFSSSTSAASVGPKSAYLVLTNSTAYSRMPGFICRFEARPRALWISARRLILVPRQQPKSLALTDGQPHSCRSHRSLPASISVSTSIRFRSRSLIWTQSHPLDTDISNGRGPVISNGRLQFWNIHKPHYRT